MARRYVSDWVRLAVADPGHVFDGLSQAIARRLRSGDIEEARPLSYALLGLLIEHPEAAPKRIKYRPQIEWLLRDPKTNHVVARRLAVFAQSIGDDGLRARAHSKEIALRK